MKRSPESSERKKGIERMRPDHERLSFLTVNQAIESIKIMTGLSMNLEDLISQCEDGCRSETSLRQQILSQCTGGMIMAGKQKTPDQAAQAVILREAGWTVSAIAERMSISVSTAQRLLKKHNAVAGACTQALIEKARDELLTTAYSLESVQQAAASLIADELALTQQIRLKLANAIESLDPADPVAFRGLAAASTALKLTQDVTRRALPLEKLNQSLEIDEIPELRIHIMTEEDVAEMRAQQRLEEAERDGDLQGAEDELENLRWMESRRLAQLKQADDYIVCEGDDSLMTGT